MLDDLPSDIVVRILLNLPVKDVIRSTLLQKSFYSLVHSKYFIDTYNHHSLLYGINPPLIILQFCDIISHPSPFPQFGLRHCNDGLEEHTLLHFPFEDRWLNISNCCNSLVCLFDRFEYKPFILWNPYIQKTLTLPEPKFELGFANFLGLGFVNETSDYKVLIVDAIKQAELYSLQHNSWKIIPHPGPGIIGTSDGGYGMKNPVYVETSPGPVPSGWILRDYSKFSFKYVECDC